MITLGLLAIGCAVLGAGYLIGFGAGRDFQATLDDDVIHDLQARLRRRARSHVSRLP